MLAVTGLDAAVDTHAHIFDPVRFPFHPSSVVKVPPTIIGTIEDYRVVLGAHGFSHALLVNSIGGYAYDNEYILDALAESRDRYRGVAVIPHDISDKDLRRLADGGFVGCRYNTHIKELARLNDAEGARTLARLKELGWFVQLQTSGDQLLEILPLLMKSGIRVVTAHCGRPELAKGIDQPGFAALCKLAATGNAWVKLSAPFRMTKQPWPHKDMEPFLRALVDAYTVDRCMWGSDWPFAQIDKRVDYGPMLSFLLHWFPDERDRKKILWDTPAALLGFK